MNDTELLAVFESQCISNDDWSHEYHIRIAAIYLIHNDFKSALNKVKDGIKKLNATNDVPESQFRGFHATLTVGWLKVVATKLQTSKSKSSLELIETCPELLDPRMLNEFYTTERLMSLEAKARFVEPDLKPLD
ncbi:MAG: hypothetical protein KJO88_09470 [Gammaproteobacteria bacterium]|nr:hypothetical protein [Gammaproteobacteria bacterium]NNM12757.1 hypothetical protein [Gammaproteobacteria bacterium]